jgi:hypothetical protein
LPHPGYLLDSKHLRDDWPVEDRSRLPIRHHPATVHHNEPIRIARGKVEIVDRNQRRLFAPRQLRP